MNRFVLLLLCLFSCCAVPAQDLSGTWEGKGEFGVPYVRLVLLRCGPGYIGYSYDTDDIGGFCQAHFAGNFDAAEGKLRGAGQGFIRRTGSHSLCVFNLNLRNLEGRDYLRGTLRIRGQEPSLFDAGDGVTLMRRSRQVDTTDWMRAELLICNPPPVVRKPPAPARPPVAPAARSARPRTPPTPPRRPENKPPVARRPVAPAPRRDTLSTKQPATVPPAATRPVPARPAEPAAPPELLRLSRERRTETVQSIETAASELVLRVYDNGIEDGDTISILHNDRMVRRRMPVTVNPQEFTIPLEGGEEHSITLIAHSLGSVPPNTASITIDTGGERYRLTASTDLSKNAVIRIRRKRGQ